MSENVVYRNYDELGILVTTNRTLFREKQKKMNCLIPPFVVSISVVRLSPDSQLLSSSSCAVCELM